MLESFATLSDAVELGYVVTGASLTKAAIRIRNYLRSEGYRDPDPVPDGLIDLTCAIAQRLASMPKALTEGGQQMQQAAGIFHQGMTYGWDAWKAKSGLDSGEMAELRRMYPHIPRSISMGSPVDLHPVEE